MSATFRLDIEAELPRHPVTFVEPYVSLRCEQIFKLVIKLCLSLLAFLHVSIEGTSDQLELQLNSKGELATVHDEDIVQWNVLH